MNSSIGGPDPTHLSARLGTLAGSLSATTPLSPPVPQHTLNPRLNAILQSLHRRRQAHETFKANHFIAAD